MKKQTMVTNKNLRYSKMILIVAIAAMLLSAKGAYAQVQVPATKGTPVNAGSLLTQFTNAIKPTTFTDGWAGEKNNWLAGASKATDAAGLASSIGSLAGFIKPGMFKSGFDVQSLIKSASTIKTMAESAGLLKKLEGGLKPEAMISSWAGKRAGWLNALKLLK